MSVKSIIEILRVLDNNIFDEDEYILQITLCGNRLLVLSNYDRIYEYEIINDERWRMR